jgi:hypothetical protein
VEIFLVHAESEPRCLWGAESATKLRDRATAFLRSTLAFFRRRNEQAIGEFGLRE